MRVDLAWEDISGEDEFALHPSFGFHYFHNKNLGLAIHTTLYPYLSSGIFIWLFYEHGHKD